MAEPLVFPILAAVGIDLAGAWTEEPGLFLLLNDVQSQEDPGTELPDEQAPVLPHVLKLTAQGIRGGQGRNTQEVPKVHPLRAKGRQRGEMLLQFFYCLGIHGPFR
ncbi:hypothetical protein Holit_03417 [Hollandina sp. SP2]